MLRVALVFALFFAVWSIYRRLPHDATTNDGAERTRETVLHIIMRRTPDDSATGAEIPVQLFSIDVAAAQREFFSERRAGVRFEDFMTRRMQGRTPVNTRLDANGQATINLPPGRWWIHATLDGTEEVTWRLPINVSGREQTVELSQANAYMRTKSF